LPTPLEYKEALIELFSRGGNFFEDFKGPVMYYLVVESAPTHNVFKGAQSTPKLEHVSIFRPLNMNVCPIS
jgi:hypothetical protein